jgi:glycosyltransferase involved in cell wall biosynthesis
MPSNAQRAIAGRPGGPVRPRVLMLVENRPIPLDPRVWPECLALSEHGFDVTVICPQGDNGTGGAFERLDGIDIHRYRPAPADGSTFGYLREYVVALLRTLQLVRRLGRRQRFDVVHACNPPDLLLLTALPLRRRGARFVFDHHDLVPELYLCRFGRRGGLLYRVSRVVEALTFHLADVVIATNESYRRVALTRGRKRPEDVFVVRNAPDLDRLRPVPPTLELKRGLPHLLVYVGMMGPQDGVDVAVRALAHLADRRRDWHAIFVGDGDMLEPARRLAAELGLAERVEFTGYVADVERVRELVGSADVCLAPEPKNALTDASTMIKIAEYMAMERPVVCFDLTESRYTAGEAALYADPNDERSFAGCIDRLLDDPDLRAAMGTLGRARVQRSLSWERSRQELYAAYDRALAPR